MGDFGCGQFWESCRFISFARSYAGHKAPSSPRAELASPPWYKRWNNVDFGMGGPCLALLSSQRSESIWGNGPKLNCLDEMHSCSPMPGDWRMRRGGPSHFHSQARKALATTPSFSGPVQRCRRSHSEREKKNNKITAGGKGLQTCQSVVVLSESNPDWLGNDYLRWMISARRLK